MIKVRDILKVKSNNVCSISSRTSVFRSLEIMNENNIDVLVVTQRGCVVGIFSEIDYARKKNLNRSSLKKISVGKLMDTSLVSISPEKSIEECVALMTETRNSHLPVFENNKLIGIVSVGDIVQSPEYKKSFNALE